MSRAYLGLGTNMGDRLDYLNKACDLLEQNENVLSLKKSNLYETKAWGYLTDTCLSAQDNYKALLKYFGYEYS